ncbi:hypothetical protein ACQEU5_24000 [Marinactinospora thermotolerans]|uniref:CHAD domain-containing protein n=1 Tax=Marinactinospora thermotolerans DSM 45154 TaxID=1122192 RepID=A0A1T4KAB3_9ACTN|nr:hypothetical protein [Marinactinospora thermotolerans]SJZ39297.1 hypothetical protein SAMN02745673_00264 [Marinactinospora thermotolerans DSM 45154]
MRLGGRKVGPQARERHDEDRALAGRLPELLDAAAEAERALHDAQRRGADVGELHRLGRALDGALTEAMRAAYARRRTLMGPRALDDRIYRRRAMARPAVKEATALAERLLTLRERHRLHGIERLPRSPVS